MILCHGLASTLTFAFDTCGMAVVAHREADPCACVGGGWSTGYVWRRAGRQGRHFGICVDEVLRQRDGVLLWTASARALLGDIVHLSSAMHTAFICMTEFAIPRASDREEHGSATLA